MWGSSSQPLPLTLDLGSSSWPFLHRCSLAFWATAPDLGCRVTPLGRHPSGMGSSWLLPLTSDVGYFLSATLSALVTAARLIHYTPFNKLTDFPSKHHQKCIPLYSLSS